MWTEPNILSAMQNYYSTMNQINPMNAYNAAAALYSQGRLAVGRYLDKFDVTEKATVDSVQKEKAKKAQQKQSKTN